MKVNGPGKQKLGQGRNYGTDYKHIWLYSDLLRAFKLKKIISSGVLTEGTLIFLRPQCPITRTHLRQREMESYNMLNYSNNKTVYANGLFCHNKWVAKRQLGHRNLEFHIVRYTVDHYTTRVGRGRVWSGCAPTLDLSGKTSTYLSLATFRQCSPLWPGLFWSFCCCCFLQTELVQPRLSAEHCISVLKFSSSSSLSFS